MGSCAGSLESCLRSRLRGVARSLCKYPLTATNLYRLVTEANGVNNLLKVVARQRRGRESYVQPLDRESNTLTIRLLSHPCTAQVVHEIRSLTKHCLMPSEFAVPCLPCLPIRVAVCVHKSSRVGSGGYNFTLYIGLQTRMSGTEKWMPVYVSTATWYRLSPSG